ncbi:hypothetical protein Tco_1219431 [Tanacetum coccineum]
MTHDPPKGVVRFTNGNDEVAYKMPHKIEQYNSLSNLEKEHTKSVYLRNKEDKRRGVEYVMSKILGFYKECLELGPEYLTGMDDEGKVTKFLIKNEKEIFTDAEDGIRIYLDGVASPAMFLALGYHLEEIHVNWAHLEKKRTRLRTCTKIHQEVLFSERGDGIAGIKRRRRDLSGDGVWILATASQVANLKWI